MNQTEVSLKFENYVHGDKKLEKYAEHLNKISSALSGIDQGKINAVAKSSDNIKNLSASKEKLNKKIDFGINIAGLSKLKNLLYNTAKAFTKVTSSSASYIENINLLEVAYSNANESIEQSSQRIETFISKMAEVYGLDESDLSRKFGIFKQLANAMELPKQQAEDLSELMVKMTNDIASLYNLDLNRASNALQSALAGQVRPIRSATGADITEKTLKKTVDALDLDRNISQLSFVEKRLIMVISLTNQLKNAQGDYGRTIESVSNQVRVLHEQWDRLTRSVGNVFYPILQNILPYLNGIIMTLTEIFNMIASLLGFKMPEFDYSGLSSTSDAVLDLEDELNGASAGVDKLSKKLSGLRGFDKLNVINTPKNSGASVSTSAGAINPKILEAFNKSFGEYDDILGKVRMKANDIRDSIMKWLGFTKEINPLTGEVEWKYEGIGKTFSNIWKSIKSLSPSMKILLTGIGVLIASKTIKALGELVNHFKSLSGFNKVLVGSGGLLMGFELISAGMDEINEKGLTLKGTFELLGGTMSNIFGGAMIGSIFGVPGAIIGAVAGAFVSLYEGMSNYKNEFDKLADSTEKSLEPIKQYNDELQRQFDIIDENAKQQNLTVAIHQGLFNELQKITDENGRVKKGYEKRAEFIITELNKAYGLEIQMIDGVIQEYDKQKKSIQEVIDQKKIEIATEIASEKYKIAIQEQTEAYNKLTEAKKIHNEATKDVADFEAKLGQLWKEDEGFLKNTYHSFDEYMNAMKESNETYLALKKAEQDAQEMLDKTQDAYNDTQEAILVYNNVVTSAYEGNAEEAEYWMNKLLSNYDEEKDIYTKMADEAEASYKSRLEKSGKAIEDSNESEKALYNEKYNNLVTSLQNEVSAIKDNEDDYINAWMEIGVHSKDMFLDGIKDLPDDIQGKLKEKFNTLENAGKFISENIQNGLDKYAPTLNIKANTNLIKTKLQSLSKAIPDFSHWLQMAGININKLAGGGMPSVGQIFIANERGPELVGQIGGQSFVANQNQMMDLLDKKIGNAQGSGTQVFNIYLDENNKIASYTIDQLQNMAKTDGKPITIGG